MTVTVETIATRLQLPAPEAGSIQEQAWQMLIADALMFIEARRDELGADEPDEIKIDYVVREAVVAHIRRPDDATQVTVSVDDASSTKTFRSGKGRVQITDEWWQFLGLAGESEGAFVLDRAPANVGRHLPWCAVRFGALYCSCGTDIAGRPIFEGG